MTDNTSDDSRLRATEQQMRRALGLGSDGNSSSGHTLSPASTARSPRRFARDGEVAVAIMRRDHDEGGNKLDAARQSLQEQTMLREQAEHQLRDARVAIQDLQTKLGHAEIAREESARQIEQQMSSLRQEIEAEHALRLKAEAELGKAMSARMKPSKAEPGPSHPRRRGRPPKAAQEEEQVVEWWTPGWEERFR
jgi:chromosome segregation ATPase